MIPRVFESRHALLDPTITQAHKPEWGIILQHPLCLRVDDDFTAGKRQFTVQHNGTSLTYEAFPDDKSYNDRGDMMMSDGIDDVAAKVIGQLKL